MGDSGDDIQRTRRRARSGPRFRPAVAALVFGEDGRLLVGRRNDSDQPHWQFPQGGMKRGESAEDAVMRELDEELGTTRIQILGVLPRRTRYVWRGETGKDHFDGQSHVWFVVQLVGELEEMHPSEEFDEFDWIDPSDILSHTHPVRRATYAEVQRMLDDWRATRE